MIKYTWIIFWNFVLHFNLAVSEPLPAHYESLPWLVSPTSKQLNSLADIENRFHWFKICFLIFQSVWYPDLPEDGFSDSTVLDDYLRTSSSNSNIKSKAATVFLVFLKKSYLQDLDLVVVYFNQLSSKFLKFFFFSNQKEGKWSTETRVLRIRARMWLKACYVSLLSKVRLG